MWAYNQVIQVKHSEETTPKKAEIASDCYARSIILIFYSLCVFLLLIWDHLRTQLFLGIPLYSFLFLECFLKIKIQDFSGLWKWWDWIQSSWSRSRHARAQPEVSPSAASPNLWTPVPHCWEPLQWKVASLHVQHQPCPFCKSPMSSTFLFSSTAWPCARERPAPPEGSPAF